MKTISALLTLFLLSAQGRKIGRSSEAQCDNEVYAEAWTAAGEVPTKIPEIPPTCLDVNYNGQAIMIKDTVSTAEMLEKPVLGWKTEEGALYTIFMLDYGIERLEGLQYYHWMMANVEDEFGFELGDEVI